MGSAGFMVGLWWVVPGLRWVLVGFAEFTSPFPSFVPSVSSCSIFGGMTSDDFDVIPHDFDVTLT